MVAKIVCYALNGLEGVPVEVETDVNRGIPAYEMVGLPDTAVKESKERVRSALKNSSFPQRTRGRRAFWAGRRSIPPQRLRKSCAISRTPRAYRP